MPHARRYAILGTGALGGFYGARLCRAGCDVHFLLHSDFEHVRQHGLVVDSKDGDFVLPRVRAYRDVRDMPRCDVAAVALKATNNHLLPSLLPPVLAEGGVVLLMQNGLGGEEEAARAAPGHAVVAGLCFLCSNKVGPGHICHSDYGEVRFAQYAADGAVAGVSDSMRAIGQDFASAGIEVDLLDDLLLARWQKLVWNVPISGLSVVLDADTRELMADPHTRALAEDIMREVVAGARSCGRPEGRFRRPPTHGGGGHLRQPCARRSASRRPHATGRNLVPAAQVPGRAQLRNARVEKWLQSSSTYRQDLVVRCVRR
jgi:2-dehydropantoate 2-reductase